MTNNQVFANNFIEIMFIKNLYPKLFKILLIIPGIFCVLIVLLVNIYLFCLFQDNPDLFSILFIIAIFILLYYIWWLIRGFEFIVFTLGSVFKLREYDQIDFQKILYARHAKLSLSEQFFAHKLKSDLKTEDIIHWFMIPTVDEDEAILIDTLENILQAKYDKAKFAVTIHGEERKIEHFKEVINSLIAKFKDKFGYFSYTIHPQDVPGEVLGKGGNIKYGANIEYPKILQHFQITPDKVIVTTLDADNNIDSNYPLILTYHYLCADNRKNKAFQPIIFFFNNFLDAPFFSKIIGLGNSFWILFNATKNYGMRNFSSHAQPLDALIELKFWSCETIVEDGHQYWRSYFGFQGNYECLPIYTKIYHDCNLNKNWRTTAVSQYKQMRRWSHGSEDIPYVFCQWVYNYNNLPYWRTFYEFFRLFESIIMWSTLHIILMTGFAFTLIKDIRLSSHISLGGTISIFIKLSIIILFLVVIMQMIYSPWNRWKNKLYRYYKMLQFILIYFWLVGPLLLIFAGIPAMHTQIALLCGKPMKKFNVTTKVRIS